ncbi:MAG: 30S ribosomal protein S11 [Minisyncoccales bacterium]|jgi:small subunit ribosomal protein S11
MGKKRIIEKTEAELEAEKEKLNKEIKKTSKTRSRGLGDGRVYISCSYNNTVISLTDSQGNVLSWATAGNIGFRGSKKATPFAASKVVEVLAQKAQKLGIERIDIFVKGVGGGRDSAIRALASKGFDITSIKDTTPIPHNGCRPKKARRV